MAIDKRINFRFGGAYQGGSGAPGSAEASSKSTSPGTGGSKGNIGGGGGGQESNYRQYSPPTKPTYTSANIDQKPITGDDYRRAQNEFINNLNQNNLLRAQQTNTPFVPYQGGARTTEYYNPNPLKGILTLAAGMAVPGLGFLLTQGGRLKDGIMSLNNKIQNSDFGRSKNLMDYLDIRNYGGYDERELARQKTMQSSRDLQADIDSGMYDGMGVKPVQTFEFDPSNFNTRNIATVNSFDDIEGQVAELTNKQKAFIKNKQFALQENLINADDVFNTINNPDLGIYDKGIMGFGEQEPTTLEEYNNYLQSLGINQRAV
jgi:hypothetical protein